MDAYEVSSLPSAKSLGSQMMKKPKIEAAVSEWMDYHGLTRDYRVKTLRKHVDNRDPNVSLKALEQSWKLGGNYHETHLHVEMNIDDLMQSKQEAEERLLSYLQELEELKALNKKESTGVIDTDDKFSQRAIDQRINKLEKDAP